MRMIWIYAGVAAAGLGAVWLAGGLQPAQAAGVLPYSDPVRVAEGQEIYVANCAACHGARLEGAPNWRERDAEGYMPAPPHDASGHTWHHPDLQLIAVTTYGTEAVVGNGYRSRMIGYQDVLSEQDILDVLAYIKSTWPDRVIEQHNKINERSGG